MLPRWLGLAALAGALLQAVAWISFFAPTGPLAAGGLPNVVSFSALLAWLTASSLVMLVRRISPPTGAEVVAWPLGSGASLV